MRKATSKVIYCFIVLLTEQTKLICRSKMTRISVNSAHWKDLDFLQNVSSKFHKNKSEKNRADLKNIIR